MKMQKYYVVTKEKLYNQSIEQTLKQKANIASGFKNW
jgi:hypothetical protein